MVFKGHNQDAEESDVRYSYLSRVQRLGVLSQGDCNLFRRDEIRYKRFLHGLTWRIWNWTSKPLMHIYHRVSPASHNKKHWSEELFFARQL